MEAEGRRAPREAASRVRPPAANGATVSALGRYKIQVWYPTLQRWKTAYCRSPGNLEQNRALLRVFKFQVR